MSSEIVNPHHIYCVWICYFKIPWKFVNLGEFEPHHIFVFGCVILKFLESLLILEIELSLLICIPRTCHVSHSLEGSETYKRILLNLHLQITDIFCCYSNVPNFDPYINRMWDGKWYEGRTSDTILAQNLRETFKEIFIHFEIISSS